MPTITNYFWNPLTDSVIEETEGLGNPVATYTNKPCNFGPLISENRNGQTSYFHCDALGSTRLTTDSSANQVDSFLFDAWGTVVASVETTATPYKWSGHLGY